MKRNYSKPMVNIDKLELTSQILETSNIKPGGEQENDVKGVETEFGDLW